MSELELKHYGMPRRSGRYPWGSGQDPYQSAIGFRGMVRELRSQGLTEVQIAEGMGIVDKHGKPSTTRLRALTSINNQEIRAAQVAEAIRLRDKGMSNMAIGRQMGINESTVRSLLDPAKAERAAVTQATVNMLKQSVTNYGYIDVGTGVENHIGVSRTKLNTAIAELEEQGYKLHFVKVEQLGIPGQYTTVRVLAGPESTYREVFDNKDLIMPVTGRSEDFGRTYSDLGLKPIKSVKSDRVMIRYKEDGGALQDGVIELRRGVGDLDLGNDLYAQVRIGVDDTHYMKGMALYTNNIPEGVDIVYNTNKSSNIPKMEVMKKMKDDPDNPFGSTIRSIVDMETGERIVDQKGAINKIRGEGDWDTWSKSISSQVLSKQTPALAKQQLDLAYQLKAEEFQEIMALTNPAVKKQLLNSFADDADSSAVHLKAAALPRQSSKVILPITNMKPNEVYAPTYNNGETVVLIRHPHGGPFEIPQLTVNNKSRTAKSIIGNAQDAIGINPKVAERLSGADFDGDTVIVIPNPSGKVKTRDSLSGLKDFDPKESYPPFDGMKTIDGGIYNASTREVEYGPKGKSSQPMQTKMGEVSNLITDMSIRGAHENEIARAVRHSMVVIDSEKHSLNYKQSYIDNGISSLAEKYQGTARGGASTVVSQASSTVRIAERKPGALVGPISKKTGAPTKLYIDPNTGEKLYTDTGATYVKRTVNQRTGEVKETVVARTTAISKMERAFLKGEDAHALSSGTTMETIYANHANKLHALANAARKEVVVTKPMPYSPSAKTAYAKEVAALNASLNIARKNKPIERQALIIANAVVARKEQSNPGMTKAEITKIRNQALAEARTRTGAKKYMIEITPRQWEAIQAGAVSDNTLKQILNSTDLTMIKQYATPRQPKAGISDAKIKRAESMLASGYTQAEVADALGISVSALTAELYK